MRLTIRPEDQVLARYSNALGALGERDGHKALARAVNRTTDTVYSRVIRAIAKQSSIPTQIVRSQVHKRTVRPGHGDSLEGVIYATGQTLPLRVFKPRQFSYGVKVKLWGRMRRMEGAFIFAGHFRSGKEVAQGHVFQRVTSRSLPIAMQRGPAVPSEMVRDQSAKAFEDTVAQVLPARISHEIGRLLPSG